MSSLLLMKWRCPLDNAKSNVLAGSKSLTRQVPPPKRYGTQRKGGSQRYGDGA